jgi:serine phosphatase RsbU (regulator of sigma subunit)
VLSIEIAIAKTHKYASRDSGDTAEIVERPTGGLSVVLVDGQGSGAAAKSLSMMVSSKAVGLLKEGVRDGAVARGTHDFLHAYRHGRVSATLDIVSVDLATSTLLVTRNSDVPYLRSLDGEFRQSDKGPGPIGRYRHTRPAIEQYPLVEGMTTILFTDGVASAGQRGGERFDPFGYVSGALTVHTPAHDIADDLLAAALAADSQRPNDDMTVVAVTIIRDRAEQPIRTQRVRLPFPG